MNKNNVIKNNFMVITSLLTLIIMLVGATFAYFATVVKAEDPISVSSLDIRIDLKIFPLYNGLPLVPTNDTDINLAYQYKCKDSLGNGACAAYTIKVTNLGDAQDIIGTFKIDNENFKNLKYIIFDEENNKYQDITTVSTEPSQIGDSFSLEKNETKTLTLLMWLSNLEDKQDYEQGQEFKGIVTMNSSAGAKLTGTITEIVE